MDAYPDDDQGDEEDGWALPPFGAESKLRLMAAMCSTCIFRPGNLMDLERGRVRGMLAEVRRNDSYVPCHKTLGTGRPSAVCKGSSEAHMGQLERIAYRLGGPILVTEDDLAAEALAAETV